MFVQRRYLDHRGARDDRRGSPRPRHAQGDRRHDRRSPAGSTFVAAANKHPEAFPAFYLGVLGSAELTGNLDETLDKLAGLHRSRHSARQVESALAYPAVVVGLAFVTVVMLAGFVLPQFKTLFEELGSDLPFSTKLLLVDLELFTDLWFVPCGTHRRRRSDSSPGCSTERASEPRIACS